MYNSMYGGSMGSYGSSNGAYGSTGSYGMPSSSGSLRNQQMPQQNNNQNQP